MKVPIRQILRRISERVEPLVITESGVAKAFVQDIASSEQMQETMALLKIWTWATARVRRERSYAPRLQYNIDCRNCVRRTIDELQLLLIEQANCNLEDIHAQYEPGICFNGRYPLAKLPSEIHFLLLGRLEIGAIIREEWILRAVETSMFANHKRTVDPPLG